MNNRIGMNYTPQVNIQKSEIKKEDFKAAKLEGKTEIKQVNVRDLINVTDKSSAIAPPEHKDINPNIDNIVNTNDTPKTETKEILHDDGSKTITTTTTDSNGNIISEHREDYDANGTLRFVYDMQNGENTQTIKRLNYDENGVLRKESTVNFGPNGSSIYDLVYDENGHCISQYTEDRDINGHILAIVEVNDTYDSNGNKTNRHIVQYGSKGNIIADFNITYENGTITGERLFYDEISGRLTKSIIEITKENGEKSVKTTNYNEDGSYVEVEESYDQNGNLVRKKEKSEDANGNVTITTTTYNADGSIKNSHTSHMTKTNTTTEPKEMHARFE